MQRIRVEYDAALLPGICFPSVSIIVWGLTFPSKLESRVMHGNHFYSWRAIVFHGKYCPVHPHTIMRQLDHNIQDVLQLYYRTGGKKQSKPVWSPNWNLFWNICFTNKQIKAQLEFSQPFSRNHIESQNLDEFCNNLQININLLGRGEEVKIFPFLSFRV